MPRSLKFDMAVAETQRALEAAYGPDRAAEIMRVLFRAEVGLESRAAESLAVIETIARAEIEQALEAGIPVRDNDDWRREATYRMEEALPNFEFDALAMVYAFQTRGTVLRYQFEELSDGFIEQCDRLSDAPLYTILDALIDERLG